MICKFKTDEERRKARLAFYKDDVFVIAHRTISKIKCCLTLEEIFCTAENLANHLLSNEITEKGFIDFEIDDFEAECDDKEAIFPILVIAYVKLCALRQRYPLAGNIVRAMAHRPQRYDGFNDILRELLNREIEELKKRRIDLLSYELKTIEKGNPNVEIISMYVNAVLECATNVIEGVIVSFTNFNDEQNHKFDMQLHALMQGYKDKQEGKMVTKIDVHINNVEMSNPEKQYNYNYASGSTHQDHSHHLRIEDTQSPTYKQIEQV